MAAWRRWIIATRACGIAGLDAPLSKPLGFKLDSLIFGPLWVDCAFVMENGDVLREDGSACLHAVTPGAAVSGSDGDEANLQLFFSE